MKRESETASAGQSRPADATAPDAKLHNRVVGDPKPETNQAERAAMHPEGFDLEWHYYHGAWSG